MDQDNQKSFEQAEDEKRADQLKFARGVMYFLFPVSSYIAAVIASYPGAVFESVRYGTGSPPEDSGMTPVGIVIGLLVGYFLSKKVYNALTAHLNE